MEKFLVPGTISAQNPKPEKKMDDELRKKLAARLKIQEQDPAGSAPSHAGADSAAAGGSATTPGRLKIPQGLNPGRFNPAIAGGIPPPFGMGRPPSMGSSQAFPQGAKESSVGFDLQAKIRNREKGTVAYLLLLMKYRGEGNRCYKKALILILMSVTNVTSRKQLFCLEACQGETCNHVCTHDLIHGPWLRISRTCTS